MSKEQQCPSDDPNRCQATTSKGQCKMWAAENSKFCYAHSTEPRAKAHERRVKHYLLSNPELQERLNRQAGLEEVRSLREEIHLARVMVEKRLDMVEDGDRGDMLAAFSSVNTYLATIEKLVNSCNRMELSLGKVLSKASIFSLGQEIVTILVDELHDIEGYEDIVDRISERIVAVIAEQKNDEKN